MMDMKDVKEMFPHNIERLLGELGLQKRRSAADYILPAVGVFAAGAIVGGILGLLFAPSSGRELRGQINDRLRPAFEPEHDHEPHPRDKATADA